MPRPHHTHLPHLSRIVGLESELKSRANAEHKIELQTKRQGRRLKELETSLAQVEQSLAEKQIEVREGGGGKEGEGKREKEGEREGEREGEKEVRRGKEGEGERKGETLMEFMFLFN